MLRRGVLLLVAVPLLPLLVLWPGPGVGAATGGRITSYDVVLAVRADGTLAVAETIVYDFGGIERHGLVRTIPTRVPYDADHDRVYRVDDVHIASSTGAPTEVKRSEESGDTVLRIGDPDRTVTGRQSYRLAYTVQGALNAFPDHVELYWNAIGGEWDVPVAQPHVRVIAPVPVERSACFAGPVGSSLPCQILATGPNPTSLTFGQTVDLQPGEALTVVVGLPRDAVAATGPILEERHTLARAVTPTPLTGGLAAAIVALGGLGLGWLVTTRGRDRRFADQVPGQVPAPGMEVLEEEVPLVGSGPVAVQFRPPEGLRPGQVGTLLDERANVLDVTATIVDLAVRGHLRIEELPRRGLFSSRDWRLVKLAGGEGPLLTYERSLYDGLFSGGEQVLLSDLKRTLASRLRRVQNELYDDVTKAGWFRGRPDRVRGRWGMAGIVLAIGGGWLTVTLAERNHWVPVGAAVTLVGLGTWLLSRRMPARTARGTAVLAQVRGFREYLHTAEAGQLRYEEQQDVFSRYLPYAVVFGDAERWVRVFGPLSQEAGAGAPGWYVGPAGWSPDHFADSLGGFTASTAGAMAAASASSSGGSGFGGGGSSGGGGGGGGGGAW